MTAPPSATATTAGAATNATRRTVYRDGSEKLKRGSRTGRSPSAMTRSRSCSGARGLARRSSFVRSTLDIGHHLLQLPQGTAQSGGTRGWGDPEQTRGALAVEIEDHAQRDHLSLSGGQSQHGLLELRRNSRGERLLLPLGRR